MLDTFKNIDSKKQQKILDAAFIEFSRQGYSKASTNQLVKALGISKGSLFKYFLNKLDLYTYLVELASKELVDYMKDFEPDPNASPKDKIIAYGGMEYDYLVANPIKYRFFYQLTKEMNNPELCQVKEKIIEIAGRTTADFLNVVGISGNETFANHIKLVTLAYNQTFMETVDWKADWPSLKGDYLMGLDTHLSYIDWRKL